MNKIEAAIELLKISNHCQHLDWLGIPEVDATCSQCGLDEHEVSQDRDEKILKILEILNQIK